MLKIRTIVLSVVLAIFLILTVQMVTAETDSVSEVGVDTVIKAENQGAPTELGKTYSIPEYRSQFGACSDVSIAELAVCRAENRSITQSRLDECFDVSLMEVASCRSADQSSAP